MRAIGRRADGRPFFFGGSHCFALGVAGLGIAVYPDIVPFRLSLWVAASSTLSHVLPPCRRRGSYARLLLAYSAFAYRVFRGKGRRHKDGRHELD